MSDRQQVDPLAAYISASIKNDPEGPIAQAVRRMCAVVLDFQREWDALEAESRGESSS